MAKKLNIYQCPNHPNFKTLCIDDENGGTRIFGGKCCVAMYSTVLASWTPSEKQWRELIEEIERALEDIDA